MWAEQFDFCFLCRRTAWQLSRTGFVPLQTHEIGSRAIAVNKWCDPRNFLRVCERCHSEVCSWLPECQQLSAKLLHDGERYDRSFVNEIRNRADTAVTEMEVRQWSQFIQALRGW